MNPAKSQTVVVYGQNERHTLVRGWVDHLEQGRKGAYYAIVRSDRYPSRSFRVLVKTRKSEHGAQRTVQYWTVHEYPVLGPPKDLRLIAGTKVCFGHPGSAQGSDVYPVILEGDFDRVARRIAKGDLRPPPLRKGQHRWPEP